MFTLENGNALVHFCKMAPYAGTSIQRRLRQEGRLGGTLACPEYRFRDPKLDLLQLFCSQTFNFRNFDDGGLVERLRFAKFDAHVLRRLGNGACDVGLYERGIKDLIRQCNQSALEVMTFALAFVEQNDEDQIMRHWHVLEDVQSREAAIEKWIAICLDRLMSEYGFSNSDDRRISTKYGLARQERQPRLLLLPE